MRNRRLFPIGVIFALLASVLAACNLPQLEDYDPLPLAQTSFLYAGDGSLITELHATEDRVVLRRNQMAPSIRDATVAIEDRRFYYHHGFDGRAIIRAAYVNAAEGQVVEGGSTITQQLVKILYVGNADTLGRKIDEAALAWQLEDRFTKDQILTRYLNTVYFGEGAYGVQAAARTYFSIDAKELTLSQSAVLAGLITAPNHFDPSIRPEAAYGRRNVVLRLMRDLATIDDTEYDKAIREPIQLDLGESTDRYPFPYFVDYFKEWFLGNPAFGRTRQDRYKLLFTGGLRINTTLDPRLQGYAEDAVHDVLAYPGDPDGAMTVLDPRTGYVRAMVGGKDDDYWKDTDAGRVNFATGTGGGGRQTGSAFKPYALVAALENGYSPSTIFSAPATLDIPLDNGDVWHVTNAEGTGYGSMTLEAATINSVNTVYVQLIQQLGPETVVEVATRMGMRCCTRVTEPSTPLLPYLSAVLGANESNTLEMSSAYGTLATGGKHVMPIPVIDVTDANGTVIWRAKPRPRQVVEPQVARVADDILQEVVSIGTGRAAIIGRPQIGKTGTGDTHTDAWFVGSVPQLTAAVWVGFHEGSIPMEPPRTRITVFGGTWPAQIWRLFMVRAAEGLPVRDFPTPPDVGYTSVPVDVTQTPYCLPNAYTLPQNISTLEFIVGTEPVKACKTPTTVQSVPIPSVIGMTQDAAETALRTAGFYVEVKVESSTQPPGTVIYQSPSAGTSAQQTSLVRITVSKGDEDSASEVPASP